MYLITNLNNSFQSKSFNLSPELHLLDYFRPLFKWTSPHVNFPEDSKIKTFIDKRHIQSTVT